MNSCPQNFGKLINGGIEIRASGWKKSRKLIIREGDYLVQQSANSTGTMPWGANDNDYPMANTL